MNKNIWQYLQFRSVSFIVAGRVKSFYCYANTLQMKKDFFFTLKETYIT